MNFEIIEEKRKARQFSVSKLCELAGIDRKTYYNVKANPDSATFETVKKLVEALRLDAVERNKVLF